MSKVRISWAELSELLALFQTKRLDTLPTNLTPEHGFSEDFISTYYIRDDPLDEIILTQCTKQSFIPTLDTEGIVTTDIELSNGMRGFYFTNKGVNTMVLHNFEYDFMISSQNKLNELIKFAESLKIKNNKSIMSQIFFSGGYR